MASAHVVKYLTGAGPRWRVRYRLAGRGPLRHAGSFASRREALLRLRFVQDELAAGRAPGPLLERSSSSQTLTDVAAAWLASRVDVAPATLSSYRKHLARLLPAFGRLEVSQVTLETVQAWIASQGDLEASTLRRYVLTLRQVLDHAGCDPNPARLARLPRIESRPVDPPTAAAVRAMVAELRPSLRLAVMILEATGVRVGELVALTWGDVDSREGRFRVSAGKTRAARRFVQLPAELLEAVEALVPREDRRPDLPVFAGLTEGTIRNGMARACRAAGVPHMTPHDLRRRRLSVWHAEGVPAAVVAQRAGHTKISMTLDVYTGVILGED